MSWTRTDVMGLAQVGTAWRPDKLKEMTYTQFWHLVQQRQIDKVCRLRVPPVAGPATTARAVQGAHGRAGWL